MFVRRDSHEVYFHSLGASSLGKGVAVQAHKNIGIIPHGYIGPFGQSKINVGAPRQNNLKTLFFENIRHQESDLQVYVLLPDPVRHSTGVLPTMTGINDHRPDSAVGTFHRMGSGHDRFGQRGEGHFRLLRHRRGFRGTLNRGSVGQLRGCSCRKGQRTVKIHHEPVGGIEGEMFYPR